jgi:hypothetical protein
MKPLPERTARRLAERVPRKPSYPRLAAQLSVIIRENHKPDSEIYRHFMRSVARLSIGQRAMLGARVATARPGKPTPRNPTDSEPHIRRDHVAAVLEIIPQRISEAHLIRNKGSREEICAIEDGSRAMHTIATQIRQGRSRTARRQHAHATREERSEKWATYVQNVRISKDVWKTLRVGLEALTSLPAPRDVVEIARLFDRGMLNDRLFRASEWLGDFADEWTKPPPPNGSDRR